ncbi:hypothetical protein WR25_25567 [Diploscapter pachys]|uniref:Uncharacterized protein n=1 Tax=Diploscapter pachys TaxID=2018661 RepID=A0A2A2LZA6_9BILA|nr:hypothetical protein WR25_25567 [Diploscapter pachys]
MVQPTNLLHSSNEKPIFTVVNVDRNEDQPAMQGQDLGEALAGGWGDVTTAVGLNGALNEDPQRSDLAIGIDRAEGEAEFCVGVARGGQSVQSGQQCDSAEPILANNAWVEQSTENASAHHRRIEYRSWAEIHQM